MLPFQIIYISSHSQPSKDLFACWSFKRCENCWVGLLISWLKKPGLQARTVGHSLIKVLGCWKGVKFVASAIDESPTIRTCWNYTSNANIIMFITFQVQFHISHDFRQQFTWFPSIFTEGSCRNFEWMLTHCKFCQCRVLTRQHAWDCSLLPRSLSDRPSASALT